MLNSGYKSYHSFQGRLTSCARSKILNTKLCRCKVKVNLCMCLSNLHAINTYEGVGIQLHMFFTSQQTEESGQFHYLIISIPEIRSRYVLDMKKSEQRRKCHFRDLHTLNTSLHCLRHLAVTWKYNFKLKMCL